MRTIPFKQVFDRTIRLHGRDPKKNVSSDLREALVDHINERVRIICQCWRWPEWELTEERAFRQVWRDDHQYLRQSLVDNQPDEVFYLGTGFTPGDDEFGTDFGYYRVLSDAASDPPVGTLPTDTDFFEAISPLDSFIAYDQGCKRSIGIVRGVYSRNPRVPTGSNFGGLRYTPSDKGIDVCGSGNSTVFLTYTMPVPKYTMMPWVAGKTYARADVVLDITTGECFQALTSTSNAVSDTDDWRRIPFPEKWANYVCNGAFADSLLEFDQGGNGELQGKVILAQAASERADTNLQAEVDALTAQGQKLQWSFCRPKSCCTCETLQTFDGGSVTTLTDACDDELGWIYPIPVPSVNPCDTSYHSEIVAILTADGTPSLEGLATTSRAITCTQITITILVSGSPEAQLWRLDSGAADPLDGGQVSPADYNATTNNKHWVKVG